MVKIINKVSKEELINFYNNSTRLSQIIIKFEADWCRPCQDIKEICNNISCKLNDNIIYVVVNIDKYPELYSFLKTKKQVNGIPTILSYRGGERNMNEWFIPNDSVIGGNKQSVIDFFNRCYQYSNTK